MHNSPWWYLNLYSVSFLISPHITVLIFLGSELEYAIIVHLHCFVTSHIVTSPIIFLLIPNHHELAKYPWQYLSHSTGFLDVELTICDLSKTAQDDRRLELGFGLLEH